MVSHAKVFQTLLTPTPSPALLSPSPPPTTHPLPCDCGLQGGKEANSACIDTVYAVRKMDHTKYFLLCFHWFVSPHIVTHINNCDTLWHTSTTVTHCDTHQQLPCLFPSHRDILNSLLFAFYNLYPRRSPASAKRQLQVNTTSRERNGIRSFLALPPSSFSGQLLAGTEIPAATTVTTTVVLHKDRQRWEPFLMLHSLWGAESQLRRCLVNHNVWRGRGAEAGNRTDMSGYQPDR